MRRAHGALPDHLARRWVWWRLAAPPRRNTDLASLLEPDADVAWHPAARTERLLSLMTKLNQQVDDCVAGVMIGMSNNLLTEKAALESISNEVQSAIVNDH